MIDARLKPEAVKAMEEVLDLDKEVWQLLDLVVAEWSSDPQSVQCFDLRIVERAKVVVARRKELDGVIPFPMFD